MSLLGIERRKEMFKATIKARCSCRVLAGFFRNVSSLFQNVSRVFSIVSRAYRNISVCVCVRVFAGHPEEFSVGTFHPSEITEALTLLTLQSTT